mmetsp:Transcript_9443/g.8449  ORF Transcript_9443/g.8449 Transcript_9443/m.8449 type:complete len:126 (-) Transcript_9443:497-874(-)
MFWIIGIITTVLFIFFIYVFLFIHIHLSSPQGKPYDEYVFQRSFPKGAQHFIYSFFSLGYIKLSWLKFTEYYYRKLFPNKDLAKLGFRSPDAEVYTLNNEKKSLLNDYINISYQMPVILNMGSYT